MVLQDLGDTPSDSSFSDNSYPAEPDTYSSSSSTSRFDASSLPQPIPVLGPILGFSQSAIRFKTESTIKFAEQRIHRRLSQEETDALAAHLYWLEQIKSYYTASGATFGAYRWYATMAENRYPLYKPKPENVNPNQFLFIKGPMAQYARHSWRLFAYVFVVAEMGKLLGQLMAQPRAAQACANDPKLAAFAQDLKQVQGRDGGRRQEQQKEWQERITRERAGRAASGSGAPSRTPWGGAQKASPMASDDDMSPTAGNDPWSPTGSSSWGDSGFASDTAQGQPQQQSQQAARAPRSWDQRTTRADDDNASPTGGMFQEEAQNQPKPGESAWDRLRRGGGSQPRQAPRRPEPPHREQREGSTLGDSFTFAESDEERKRAQEKAQREFDARIERERQGRDFNEERKW